MKMCSCSLGDNKCKLCPTLKPMNDGMPITLGPFPKSKKKPKSKKRKEEIMAYCTNCKGRIWTEENNDSGEFCRSNGLCALDSLEPSVASFIESLVDRIEALEAKVNK